MTSTEWMEYTENTKRIQKSVVPSSSVTARTVTVDGFALSQKNHAGITAAASRVCTATGMILTQTDGRGNATTTRTDLAGRTVSVTDAAGNETVTQYDPRFDLPSVVTDALGNTTCAGYDARGRKTAEWGTGTQPLLMGYDEAGRLVRLTTFRAAEEGDIAEDPTGRTDGDMTFWTYHGTYIWSGKWQPGIGNKFSPPWKVQSYIVPKNSIECPRGKGIDGAVKLLVPAKQRIYKP